MYFLKSSLHPFDVLLLCCLQFGHLLYFAERRPFPDLFALFYDTSYCDFLFLRHNNLLPLPLLLPLLYSAQYFLRSCFHVIIRIEIRHFEKVFNILQKFFKILWFAKVIFSLSRFSYNSNEYHTIMSLRHFVPLKGHVIHVALTRC